MPFNTTDEAVPCKGYFLLKEKSKTIHLTDASPGSRWTLLLFVNGPMLAGARVSVGRTAHFIIEQDFNPRTKNVSTPKLFKERLHESNVFGAFKNLIPSRQKDILKYLNYLKTEEAINRNINKVISELKSKE